MEIQDIGDLFRKVLHTPPVEHLNDDTPIEHLGSYIFLSLFKKYGKGGIEDCIYDSCYNHCLVFEVDEGKNAGIQGWFQIRDFGSHLEFSISRPDYREDSHIFSEIDLNVYPGNVRNGYVSKEPFVSINGPKFVKYGLNRQNDFEIKLFLLSVIQEDILPLSEWFDNHIKRLYDSVR